MFSGTCCLHLMVMKRCDIKTENIFLIPINIDIFIIIKLFYNAKKKSHERVQDMMQIFMSAIQKFSSRHFSSQGCTAYCYSLVFCVVTDILYSVCWLCIQLQYLFYFVMFCFIEVGDCLKISGMDLCRCRGSPSLNRPHYSHTNLTTCKLLFCNCKTRRNTDIG